MGWKCVHRWYQRDTVSSSNMVFSEPQADGDVKPGSCQYPACNFFFDLSLPYESSVIAALSRHVQHYQLSRGAKGAGSYRYSSKTYMSAAQLANFSFLFSA